MREEEVRISKRYHKGDTNVFGWDEFRKDSYVIMGVPGYYSQCVHLNTKMHLTRPIVDVVQCLKK